MTMRTTPTYSASCPTCGYEHDFANKREMESTWKRWLAATKQFVQGNAHG